MIRPDGGSDLEQLSRAYIQRMKAHPPSTWSSSLLSIVISAVDLQFGEPAPPADDGQRPQLRLV